jgi:hypothetical protein
VAAHVGQETWNNFLGLGSFFFTLRECSTAQSEAVHF